MAIDYPNPIDIQDVNDEIWFEIINRTITLKEGSSAEDILVQNDANSRNFGFVIQRYFENEDLSTKKIKVHYVNSLGQHDCDELHSIEVVGDNDDVISFMWLVSKEVCVEAGNIEFAIEFYNDNGYDWFTKPTQLGVSQGIYTIGEIDTSSDWYKIFRDSKLDKDQGVENVGKVMIVGEDGMLVPADVPQSESSQNDYISYSEPQDLTDEQKQIARNNINAVDTTELAGAINASGLKSVSVVKVQDFTEAEKAQGRENIGAISQTELDDAIGSINAIGDYISYSEPQDLTDKQKEMARNNINATDEQDYWNLLDVVQENTVAFGEEIVSLKNRATTLENETAELEEQLEDKQDTLVSGTNIKTINGVSLLGDGNITIEGTQVDGVSVEVAELREEIKKSTGEITYIADITDTLNIIKGEYYGKGGGGIATYTAAERAEIIAVKEGEKYFITGSYGYNYALIVAFDETNTYLADKSVFSANNSTVNFTDYEYVVPQGVAYLGFSTRKPISTTKLIIKKEIVELKPVTETVNEVLEELLEDFEEVEKVANDSLEEVDTVKDNIEYITYVSERKLNKTTKLTQDASDEQYPSAKVVYDLFGNTKSNGGLNGTAIDLLIQILTAGNYDSDMSSKIDALKVALNNGDETCATLRLPSNLPADTYTLKYENTNGEVNDFVDICSFTINQGEVSVYNKFIAENTAPKNAVVIGVYNSSDTRVGDIVLGSLSNKPDFGNKLYSFVALSDVHIGDYKSSDTAEGGLGTFEQRFQSAINDFMADEDISFVVLCGDMVDNANDITQLEKYQAIAQNATKPILTTMGNHEMTNILAENKNREEKWSYENIRPYFEQALDSTKGINRELHYCFTPEGSNDVFIMLGISGLYSVSKSLSDSDIKWLHNILEDNKDKRCFLFHHYFPYDGSGDAVNCYGIDGLQGVGGESFYSLLKHYSNVIYFHGHTHAKFNVQEYHPMNTIDTMFGRYSVHIPSFTNPTDCIFKGTKYAYSEDRNAGEGYIIDVYENGIVLNGKDFVNNKLVPLGCYCLDTSIKQVAENSFYDAYGFTSNALKEGNGWFEGCTVSKDTITKISFINSYLDAYDESWNPTFSENSGVTIYRNGTELFVECKNGRARANNNCKEMFAGFTALTEIKGLWRLDMTNVADIEAMFKNCSSLKTLFLSEFSSAKPVNMKNVFDGCRSLEHLDLSNFNIDKVNYFQYMCCNCTMLKTIKMPSINTPHTLYLNSTFAGCASLQSIDMTRFSGSIYYGITFKDCSSLTDIKFGEVKATQVMTQLFWNCSSLKTLDLSRFDVSAITAIDTMCANCTSLETVILPEVFDTSKVTTMKSCFSNCPNLTLDCSGWDTTSCTNITNFAYGSEGVTPPTIA